MLLYGGRGRVDAVVVARNAVVMLVWLGCLGFGGSLRAGAQTAVDGAISGFVMDESGAALVGAVIRVQGVATGQVMEARSGAKGEFAVARVAAGTY